jgi:anti-sigma regulatory factor (Ser/Thr protein kinase)
VVTAGEHIEIDVPARTEFLALVREVVTMVAETGSKLPSHRIDDLRLAVTEALANAIDAERRKPADEREPVVVRCDLDPGRIAVEVHDEAGGFDPDALPEHPEVTKPARLEYESGLGIPLMRELADIIEFRPEGHGTTVRLVVESGDRRG